MSVCGTSVALFGGLAYCIAYCTVLSCPATKQKMMFPSLPPPDRVVPIVGIIATNNGRTCNVHRFGCGNSILLA